MFSNGTNTDDAEKGTRRKFLRNVTAAGSSIAVAQAGIGKVVASPPERGDEEVQNALSDSKVQSLLEELGHPRVLPQKAATRTAELDDISMDIVYIPTVAGDITFGIREDGGTEAAFHFKDVRAKGKLPEKYQNVPNYESAILHGRNKGVTFMRVATESERSAMFDDLGIDPEESGAFISSEENAFTLKFVDDDDEMQTYKVTGASIYTESDVSEFSYEKGVSTLSHDCNSDWCWRCVIAEGTCVMCYGSCAVIGIACALCIIAFCGAGGYACGRCYHCYG
jgi:hypothetical protein